MERRAAQPRTGIAEAEDLHGSARQRWCFKALCSGRAFDGRENTPVCEQFASDVAGLVVLASVTSDWRTRNPAAAPLEDDGLDLWIRVVAVLSPTGLPRIIGGLFRPALVAKNAAELRKYVPPSAADQRLRFLRNQSTRGRWRAEIRTTPQTEESLRHARDFGDTPLIVLSEKWIVADTPGPRQAEAGPIEGRTSVRDVRSSERQACSSGLGPSDSTRETRRDSECDPRNSHASEAIVIGANRRVWFPFAPALR